MLFSSRLTLDLVVPEELMTVMHYYEGYCVMGCCGVNALHIDPECAIWCMMDHGHQTAMVALAQLNEMILKVKTHQGPVHSGQQHFGEHWKQSQDALLFLEDVRASLQTAVNTPPDLWTRPAPQGNTPTI